MQNRKVPLNLVVLDPPGFPMISSLGGFPALSRVEVGGAVRALPTLPGNPPTLVCEWGKVRAMELAVAAQEVPPGHLLNHVITLNLGADTTSESNFEDQGWQTNLTPHHGVNVYPAFVEYATREHNARDYFVIELASEFVETAVAESGAALMLRPVVGARNPFAMHVMLALAEEARIGGSAGTLRAETLGTALVSNLVERAVHLPPPVVTALSSQKLRRVLEYVTTHLDAPLTLQTLAGLAELDVFRFIRAFKQSTGHSPHRYVLEARINRAKDLLRNRALSITEIAMETGFATPSHFSVTFRRLVNATPREYRDALP